MNEGGYMKSNRYQMLFVFMSVFFFGFINFMVPNISEGNQANFIQKYDKDNDGKLSKEEFPGSDKAFSNLDKNQDGYIDKDEAKLATKERSKKEKKGKHDKSNKDKGDDDKND